MPHVAKWWHVYLFDSPLRKFILDPEPIFRPYVEAGMTILDIGCGAGSNALCLARLAGAGGRVVAADIQHQLLAVTARRARRAGLSDRIETRPIDPSSIGAAESFDFVNAFWMLHETPDPCGFLQQVHDVLSEGGKLLVVEPRGHVSAEAFQIAVDAAARTGLCLLDMPRVRFSRAAVFTRGKPS